MYLFVIYANLILTRVKSKRNYTYLAIYLITDDHFNTCFVRIL